MAAKDVAVEDLADYEEDEEAEQPAAPGVAAAKPADGKKYGD
jgi:hypothetical protein